MMLKAPLLFLNALASRLAAPLDQAAKEMDTWGRLFGLRLLMRGELDVSLQLICNPLSIVRYFELPVLIAATDWGNTKRCLDISSPRIFYLYLLDRYPQIKFDIVNPDLKDLEITRRCLKRIHRVEERVHSHALSALSLPFADASFDVVSSISVVEHIPEKGDSGAFQEMWRVLRPRGKLLVSVPCAATSREEWRNNDVYGLGNPENEGSFFFQRIYDTDAISKRLLQHIDATPVSMRCLGEKHPGTYAAYEDRWIRRGLYETVKDPEYFTSDYRQYTNPEEMPGLGVCCMVIEKGL